MVFVYRKIRNNIRIIITSSPYEFVDGRGGLTRDGSFPNYSLRLHMSDTTSVQIHPHDVEDDRYQRTMIYEIRCMVTGERYVGSTIRTLKERMRQHVSYGGGNTCCSKQIIDRGNYKASEIERRPCKTKMEALTLEGDWQRLYKAKYGDLFVNKQRAGLYYRHNPEVKKRYSKEYYANHKAERNAYNKEYHVKNQEKRCADSKVYRDTHKEESKASKSRPWTCEWCCTTIQHASRSKHKRRCKHRPVDGDEFWGRWTRV